MKRDRDRDRDKPKQSHGQADTHADGQTLRHREQRAIYTQRKK